MSGPLQGVKVIEMAGIGPAPFACMLLSDLGADVIRVDRPNADAMHSSGAAADVLQRGRRSIVLDLKAGPGAATALRLIDAADVLIEGFRPGVMEKLGLGPEPCLERNPRLVYARMTGWGQHGPLAHAAGHDINYIAVTGALAAIGRSDSGPVPPLNLLGDFGGGSLYLIMGILAALYERGQSGRGQVIDAAITDGVISLLAAVQGFVSLGLWDDNSRQSNMLDGGAHYYDSYQCADGQWVAVGAIEPRFYTLLVEKLGLDAAAIDIADQFDKQRWPQLKQQIAAAIKTKTQAQWCEIMEGSDACFAPVLTLSEAARYPHNRARQSFVEKADVLQSAPAPRFSRTPGAVGCLPVGPGADTDAILAELGLDAGAIAALKQSGATRQAGEQGA